MRLLVLAEGPPRSFDSWSGISHNVVRHLEAAGHSVHAADCDLHGVRRFLAAVLSFRSTRRKWRTNYRLGNLSFFLRSRHARDHTSSEAHRVDAILQFGATFSLPRHLHVPIFLYCDGNIALSAAGVAGGTSDANFMTTSQLQSVFRRESRIYSRAAHIFCFSNRLRRSFIEDFSIPPQRVSTVFAGSNFDSSTASPNLPLRRSSPPTVLFVGRDFHRKGGDTLLSAFDIVRRRVPHAELMIIGPRNLPDSLSRPGVHFLGHLDRESPQHFARLIDAFHTANVFCLPSRFEGLNISVLEAMLFSLPCITASSPWAPAEMVVDGETGYLVPIDGPEEIAARMVHLLLNSTLAEIMGQKGRTRAMAHFTWERVTRVMGQTMAAHLEQTEYGPGET